MAWLNELSFRSSNLSGLFFGIVSHYVYLETRVSETNIPVVILLPKYKFLFVPLDYVDRQEATLNHNAYNENFNYIYSFRLLFVEGPSLNGCLMRTQIIK